MSPRWRTAQAAPVEIEQQEMGEAAEAVPSSVRARQCGAEAVAVGGGGRHVRAAWLMDCSEVVGVCEAASAQQQGCRRCSPLLRQEACWRCVWAQVRPRHTLRGEDEGPSIFSEAGIDSNKALPSSADMPAPPTPLVRPSCTVPTPQPTHTLSHTHTQSPSASPLRLPPLLLACCPAHPSAPRHVLRSHAASQPPEGVSLKHGGHSQRNVGVLALAIPYCPIQRYVRMSSMQEW